MTSVNGKGDSPRPCNGAVYRENFSQINWHHMDPWICSKCKQPQKTFYPQTVSGSKKKLCFACWMRSMGALK